MDWKSPLLAIAIALVLTFFVFYGIDTFYPGPAYDAFCDTNPPRLLNQTACEQYGGRWQEDRGRPCPEGDCLKGWCDAQYECRGEYEAEREAYDRNVFVLGLIIGLLTFVIGYALTVEAVGTGLLGGAVLTLLVTVVRFWDHLHTYSRFFLLGAVLAVLIWVGYRWAPKR